MLTIALSCTRATLLHNIVGQHLTQQAPAPTFTTHGRPPIPELERPHPTPPQPLNIHRYRPRCPHYTSKEHCMTQEFFNSHLSAIDPRTLYKILQLRTDVFVVEQNCPYPELDGRDLEPNCELLWATVDGKIAGTTRILHDSDALRIGRVVVAPEYR